MPCGTWHRSGSRRPRRKVREIGVSEEVQELVVTVTLSTNKTGVHIYDLPSDPEQAGQCAEQLKVKISEDIAREVASNGQVSVESPTVLYSARHIVSVSFTRRGKGDNISRVYPVRP